MRKLILPLFAWALLLNSCKTEEKYVKQSAEAFLQTILEKDFQTTATFAAQPCDLFPLSGYNTFAQALQGKSYLIEKIIIRGGEAEVQLLAGNMNKPLKLVFKKQYYKWKVDCDRSDLMGNNEIILSLIPKLYDFSSIYTPPGPIAIADSFLLALSRNDSAVALALVSDSTKNSLRSFFEKGNPQSGKTMVSTEAVRSEWTAQVKFRIRPKNKDLVLPMEKADTNWRVHFSPGLFRD